MKYVLTGEENWADEFDVHFFEVLDERDKAIYDSINKIFGSWTGYYGFGTNEYFEDFEFLGWTLIPINDDEYKVIKKCNISQRTIYDELAESIIDILQIEGLVSHLIDKYGKYEWWDQATIRELEEVFYKLKQIQDNENMCNERSSRRITEGDEVF